MKSQSVECIESLIMYSQGIKKALIRTKKGSIFTSKYNKGYYDAVEDQVKKLNELLEIVVEENNQLSTQIAV